MVKLEGQQFWENRLQNQFDLHGVGYAGLGRQYNYWLYKIRKKVFHERMGEYFGAPVEASALDVGCGTGFYVERWKELGLKTIVGVDFTEISINNMRAKHPDCNFYQMDISKDNGPIADMRFDFVSAFDVLFHITDDAGFENSIRNIYSLLKPGGLFVWSDNFLHGETVRSRLQVCRTLKDIEMILQDTGFQIELRRPMFYLMNGPIDKPSHGIKIIWKILTSIVKKSEFAGACIGGMLYPLELLLISNATESPTTEIMICRRI